MRISKIHKRNSKFNLSGNTDTSGVSIDNDLAKLYSNRVVEYAKILKAKNGTKYSDAYYLDYAKSIDNREMQGAYNEVFHKKAAQCDIQDPNWRGYSYEEIIQMKNTGVKIPEDVIRWAEAQQESDITAYEVISDEAAIDDNTSTEEVSGDTNINSLQSKTKLYINRAEDTQETSKQKLEEFQTLSDSVTQIRNEKETNYKNTIEEITKLSNELDELDKKNKNGTLTQSEAKRYKELGKILNTQTKSIDNMLKNSVEVDEFLSSIDSLNKDANDNLILAEEIKNTSDDLTNFDRKINDTSATHNTKGIVYSNMGALGDLLYGINSTSIEKVALDVRTDIEDTATENLNILNSLDNAELVNFAKNYTKTVNSLLPQQKTSTNNINTSEQQQTNNQNSENDTKTQENTQTTTTQNTQQPQLQTQGNTQTTTTQNQTETKPTDLQNTNNDKTQNNTNTTTDNNNNNQKENNNTTNTQFSVVVGATAAASIAATVVSAVSTADLNSKETGLNTTSKTSQTNFAKAITDAKNLQKEQKDIEAEHQANIQELEASLNNAQITNPTTTDNTNTTTQENTQPTLETTTNTNNIDNTIQNTTNTPQITGDTQENNPNNDQINTILAKEQELSNQITKTVTTSTLSAAKSEKSKTDLQTETNKLNERNENNKQVAAGTILTGTATTAFGAYNMSVAIPMLQTGISLMLNPFTYAAGQTLTAFATQEIIKATAQITTGTAANIAGTVGITASANASKTIETTNKEIIAAQKSNQDNQKIIQEASKSSLVANSTTTNNKEQNNNTNIQNQNTTANLLQNTPNIQQNQQITPQITQPQQNEIQTRITQNTQETDTVNKKTTNADQKISSQSNKVDSIFETNTKTSQKLEEKIANLNSGNSNTNEKEDATGEIRKLQRNLANNSNDTDKFISEKENSTSEIPIQEEEQITPIDNNTSDNTNLLAASATTTANINKTTNTDDKTTKKLERFNNDSIIESKKKKKKVMAVSAATGGSVKG